MRYKSGGGQDSLCRAYLGKAEKGTAPMAPYPAERARPGGRALVLQAKQYREALQVFTAYLVKHLPYLTE